MTKVFFEAGSSELTVVDNGVNVFGANGVQTLKLKTGALNVKADSNVDKFYFDGAIADFKFQQAGVTLKVFDSTDKLIVELGIQDDDDSTPLTFTDGTVRAALVGGANGVQIQIGSVAVNSAAAKINVPTLAIDTNEKSVATVQTPVVAPSNFTLISSASNTPTPEGSNITFTVTPNGAVTKAAVLTLDFVGQALNSITNVTNVADFNSVGTISFNAGDTAAKQITVAVKNDGNPEGLEAYKVRLVDETGAEKANTLGTISDGQPVVNLSVNNSAVNEGGSVIFTLNSDVNAPVGGLVVPYNLSASTATNSLDFGITPATGTIIIPANEKSGSITVNIFNDSAVENAETVVINLDTASVSGVSFGNTSASTVINDTTAAVEPNTFFFTGPASVIEGTNAIYTLAHAPVSSPVTVDFKLTPKNGLAYGTDYTIKTTDKIVLNSGSTTNGKITFDSTTGSSLRLEIETKTDSEIETAEVLSIELSNPSAGSIAAGQSFINTVFLDSTATQNGTTYPLVTNKDSIVGSNSNDLISGYINTMNSAASTFTTGDIIDGGAGVDTLQLVVDGADAGLFPNGVTVSNVEIVSIKETGGIAGSYDLSAIAGVSTVINDKSTDDVNFVLPANAKFVVQGNSSNANGNTTFDKATEITLVNVNGGNITRNSTGSATITVNSTGTGNVLDTIDLDTGTGISTLNIGATANLTATLANNFNAATINISGSANKVDLSGAALSRNIASVNAGLLTGGVILKVDQNDRVSDTNITGGNGNDIIDIGKVQYSTANAIDAGTGIDTLKISDQDTWSSKTIGNLKNFERLEIYDDNDDNVDTFDMSQQRSITSVQINASSEKDGYILNNLSAIQAESITIAGNQVVAPKFNVTNATLIGNIDTINLNIDGAENISAIAVADIDAPGIELVNLNIVDSFTATKLTGLTSLTTLAVAGNGNVNLTTGDLPLILNSTIDASALNGKLTVDASGAKNYGMLVRGSATQASVITGSAQADLLTGGAGADVLTGGAGADTFNGGAGADTLDGGEGADIINGGAGADFVVGGAGSDTLNGGSGDDTLYYATTAELFASNALVDKISGSSGFDTLLLAGGVAVGGSDAWTGATGLDSIVGVANTTASTITLHSSAEAAGIRLVDLSSNTAATGNKIEATSFSGAANLTLIGSATGANVISGGSGADVLIGGAGSDTITAGDGADVIYTNGGNDTIELGVAAGSTTPSADSASDSIYISSIGTHEIKNFLAAATATATDKLYFAKSAFGNITTLTNGVNYAETATDLTATAPTTALGTGTVGFVEVKAATDVKLYYTTNMGAATTSNSQLIMKLTGVSDTDFDSTDITLI